MSEQIPRTCCNLQVVKINGVNTLHYNGYLLNKSTELYSIDNNISDNIANEYNQTMDQLKILMTECARFVKRANRLNMDLQEPVLEPLIFPDTRLNLTLPIKQLNIMAAEIEQCLNNLINMGI